MARVAYVTKENAPGKSKEILGKMPKIGNIWGAMGHNPGVLEGILAANGGIRSGLEPRYRELAYTLASTLNGCAYCLHYHKGFAAKSGVSEAQLAELVQWRGSKLFDDKDRAVLEVAEELTKSARLADATAAKAKSWLGDEGFVTLVSTIALANFTNRFNEGLGIELEK
jgi:AhpD family alkylhydroperoxidase